MDDLDRRSEFVTECGCQIWTGTTGSDYGLIKRKGKSYLAHRISWSITNGPIPEGLCVMHLCDTPTCINPRHLRLGTQAENMADRDRKGRGNPNGSRRKSGQILPGSRARIVTKKTSEGHIK